MTYITHKSGNIFENYPRIIANAAPSTPTGGTVYGSRIDVPAGQRITGVKFNTNVAAAGTAPTTVRAGVASAAGVILALTGNLNDPANWPLGVVTFPFTATYDVGASAASLIPVVFMSGAWGTTSPTLILVALNSSLGMLADGSDAPPSFQWTGQSDLPAVSSSLTMSAPTGRSYWMALY